MVDIDGAFRGHEKNVALRMLRSPRVLGLFRGLYNGLCRNCQVMAVRNPRAGLGEYCGLCRPKAEKVMAEVEKVLAED